MKKKSLFSKVVAISVSALALASLSQGQPNAASIINALPVRELGPAVMGGRVTDIAVYEKEPRLFYVGTAGGGVWKTDNDGVTFKPIFEREGTSSIGSVAVCQSNPRDVWVGTGEATSRNDVGWGDGVYKSINGGRSWRNMGLRATGAISRVLIDSRDPDRVWVAAQGRTWGYNAERGVYLTTDGGATWKQTLYLNQRTGAADLVLDPRNSKYLLSAMWEHIRTPAQMVTGGESSGIYRSCDGGEHWHKVEKGLPGGILGRIGLCYYRKDPRIVIASIDASPYQRGLYWSRDGGESWEHLNAASYDETGKNRLQWPFYDRPFYFSLPRIDPTDPSRIYIPTERLNTSSDGGQAFREAATNVHADWHALWIDPADHAHMIGGTDGGVAETRDRGRSWRQFRNMPIGQYYGVAYDMRKPYWVYGGLQDNGTWATPTQTAAGAVRGADSVPILGGDGGEVCVDPEDWAIVFAESQFGNVQRIDQRRGSEISVRPGEPIALSGPYAANWTGPIAMSPRDPLVLYFGGHELEESSDGGKTHFAISPVLTNKYPRPENWKPNALSLQFEPNEAYDTLTTISQSPKDPSVIWAGTDDGNIQVTRDGGKTWRNVATEIRGLAPGLLVSHLEPSSFCSARCFATIDGHKSNDYRTYLFATDDFGETWRTLSIGLPNSDPCHTVKEGLTNPNLLFLGTEFGLYVSLDRGNTWSKYTGGGFATVAVYDLKIQPTEEDLVIGTHGRSIWLLPIRPLEEFGAPEGQNVLFAPANIYLMGRIAYIGPEDSDSGSNWASLDSQPGTLISYYVAEPASPEGRLRLTSLNGSLVFAEMKVPATRGLHCVPFGLPWRIQRAGDYSLSLSFGAEVLKRQLRVENASARTFVNHSAPAVNTFIGGSPD